MESYTDSGEAKQTLLNSLEHDGLVYVRTDPDSWKVKRVRSNPNVRVIECDRSGKWASPWMQGYARVLEGTERDMILDIFRKEYGLIGYSLVGFLGRMKGMPQMNAVLSISLSPSETKPSR